MKKMLEETFLAIEQMGYGIIDPVIAHWEIPAEAEQKKTNLSDSVIRDKQNIDWDKFFQEIEELVKAEGIWSHRD